MWAEVLTIQLASNVSFLLIVTDPLIILRNADVRDILSSLFSKLRSCRSSVDSSNEVHTNTSVSVELQEMGQELPLQ